MNDRRRKTTREEILKLEPGPELDRLVAERVMGWKEGKDFGVGESGIVWYIREGPKYFERTRIEAWSPSTDIAAAWQVVEKLANRGIVVVVESEGALNNIYEVLFYRWGSDAIVGIARGSICEAICRAALLAVMEASDE